MEEVKSLIDRTNKFYIDMSRKVLTEKEYEIVYQMLVNKKPIIELANDYNLTRERIRQIYRDAYNKVKSIAELFQEIDYYKQHRDKLRADCRNEYSELRMLNEAANAEVLEKKLIDSAFPFSKRLLNMLVSLDIHTIGDLVAMPLQEYQNFRGFKTVCKKELKAFIEFKHLEELFDSYRDWSKKL
ncbi:sigma factor-like helix-turn-helix DNA-binding protein [Olivibacter sitiensis]|uniref:sigma factor-like helix-turn-helix DNA-binding protein n=1 Tax=Olivibacter sitiensis TaxID=376470 RepID=UPI00041AED13|nr:sigma factor-like helix-turn-helix DNA-binding protein [Olivibacter sitiensis]